MPGTKSRLRVCVRMRKKLDHEQDKPDTAKVVDQKFIEFINSNEETLRFGVDAGYDEDTEQRVLFRKELKDPLNIVSLGGNLTLLVYGNTGSGKTFTIQGDKKNPGMVPLSMKRLFAQISKQQESNLSTYDVTISCCEIYNEDVFDLIEIKPKPLGIFTCQDNSVQVKGLHHETIKNFDEFLKVSHNAQKNRSTAPTLLNASSSRSHYFIIVNVKRTIKSSGKVFNGKLYFVDLAGSENNNRTGNKGKQLKESGNINKSLLTFNMLITALSEGRQNVESYYRQSKLTRLLKDSLGGNSHSILIANIAQGNYTDSKNTLKLASKGMKVVNTTYQTVTQTAVPVSRAPSRAPLRTINNNTSSNKIENGKTKPGKRNAMTMERNTDYRINPYADPKKKFKVNTVEIDQKDKENLALLRKSKLEEAVAWTRKNNKKEALECYRKALTFSFEEEDMMPIVEKIKKLDQSRTLNNSARGSNDLSKNKQLKTKSFSSENSAPKKPTVVKSKKKTSGFEIFVDSDPRGSGEEDDVKTKTKKSFRTIVGIERVESELKLLNYVNENRNRINLLQSLNGIGKVTAQKIVDEGMKSEFPSIEDLHRRLNFSDKKMKKFIDENLENFVEL